MLYESEDADIDRGIKSMYRFLYKQQRLFKFEHTLIIFLKKQSTVYFNKKKLKTLFIDLMNQFRKLEKDPFEKNAFEYFDFISWLESKIENRPFAEVLKEKAKPFDKKN